MKDYIKFARIIDDLYNIYSGVDKYPEDENEKVFINAAIKLINAVIVYKDLNESWDKTIDD